MEPGESILMISMVKKLQKLSSKKVQLILTNKPKLIYVDPSKLAGKGNMIWSDDPNDLSIQVSSPSHFKIFIVSPSIFPLCHKMPKKNFSLNVVKSYMDYILLCCLIFMQPKKVMSFEDPKQRAYQWKKAIEALQNR